MPFDGRTVRAAECDLALLAIRVEPTQVQPGDGARVEADVANLGPDVSPESAVRWWVDGEEQTSTALAAKMLPGEVQTVAFKWLVPEGPASIRLSARIECDAIEDPSPHNNAANQTIALTPGPSGQFVTLHSVVPPVHQWVAFQGWRALPRGTALKNELAQYLPTDADSSFYATSFSVPSGWKDNGRDDPDRASPGTALIEGVWEEDEITLSDTVRSGNHFWDPDAGYDQGILTYRSALEQAQEEFSQALKAYPSDKVKAWWWLGRVAHLVTDMSVPAHVLLDLHIPPDNDAFEGYAASNGHYRQITAQSEGAALVDFFKLPAYPRSTPGNYNAYLTRILNSVAEAGDDFDSDDSNGSSIGYGESNEYGQGVFTLARTPLDAARTFARAELWSSTAMLRQLAEGQDYQYFDGRPAFDETSLYYYASFVNAFGSSSRVRVVYGDGSSEFHSALESVDSIPDSILGTYYLPQLLSRAIGSTAALYELFWMEATGEPPRRNAAATWHLYP